MLQGVSRQIVWIAALAALGASSMSVSPASARDFQALLDEDGSGSLFSNSGGPIAWEACDPDLSSCAPFASGQEVSTKGAPPNTVFRAGRSIVSPVWHGNVSPLTPPSVSGAVRGNELVVPVPGEWEGGWEGDYDLMELVICKTDGARDCIALTTTITQRDGCKPGSAVLAPALAGRYLGVVDRRITEDTFFLNQFLPAYRDVGAVDAGPTVSVTLVRIGPANGPRPAGVRCGGGPIIPVSFSERGTVRLLCRFGCRAVLTARRGQCRRRVVREVARSSRDVTTLRIPPRVLLRRLGPGRVRMILRVWGDRIGRRFEQQVVRIPGPQPRRGAPRRARRAWLARCRAAGRD